MRLSARVRRAQGKRSPLISVSGSVSFADYNSCGTSAFRHVHGPQTFNGQPTGNSNDCVYLPTGQALRKRPLKFRVRQSTVAEGNDWHKPLPFVDIDERQPMRCDISLNREKKGTFSTKSMRCSTSRSIVESLRYAIKRVYARRSRLLNYAVQSDSKGFQVG